MSVETECERLLSIAKLLIEAGIKVAASDKLVADRKSYQVYSSKLTVKAEN